MIGASACLATDGDDWEMATRRGTINNKGGRGDGSPVGPAQGGGRSVLRGHTGKKNRRASHQAPARLDVKGRRHGGALPGWTAARNVGKVVGREQGMAASLNGARRPLYAVTVHHPDKPIKHRHQPTGWLTGLTRGENPESK
jgi:hypothetical protein